MGHTGQTESHGSEVVQTMGFTGQAKEKQKEARARKKQRNEELRKLALTICTENLEDNSMFMHGETSIYCVKRNGGSVKKDNAGSIKDWENCGGCNLHSHRS